MDFGVGMLETPRLDLKLTEQEYKLEEYPLIAGVTKGESLADANRLINMRAANAARSRREQEKMLG